MIFNIMQTALLTGCSLLLFLGSAWAQSTATQGTVKIYNPFNNIASLRLDYYLPDTSFLSAGLTYNYPGYGSGTNNDQTFLLDYEHRFSARWYAALPFAAGFTEALPGTHLNLKPTLGHRGYIYGNSFLKGLELYEEFSLNRGFSMGTNTYGSYWQPGFAATVVKPSRIKSVLIRPSINFTILRQYDDGLKNDPGFTVTAFRLGLSILPAPYVMVSLYGNRYTRHYVQTFNGSSRDINVITPAWGVGIVYFSGRYGAENRFLKDR